MQQAWNNVNPHYAAYCRAHGAASVADMLAIDSAKYPGGKMGGFIIWNSQKLREWRTASKRGAGPLSADDFTAYQAWLNASLASKES